MEFVFVIKNQLDHDICDKIIEMFENDSRKYQGKTLSGVNTSIKDSIDLSIPVVIEDQQLDEEWVKIDRLLSKNLTQGILKYFQHLKRVTNGLYGLNWRGMVDKGYTVQRTSKGGHYVWHSDEGTKDDYRVYAFIWYLNTLKPEDGGCTEFANGLRIYPEKGQLLLFPATWPYIHRGANVLTDTNKYIITGFTNYKDE